jgi:hypothetical protein
MQRLQTNVDTTLISGQSFDVGASTLIPRWNINLDSTLEQRYFRDVHPTSLKRRRSNIDIALSTSQRLYNLK